MQIPVVQGVIDRRILVNYRIDPEVLRTMLPEPFRPQLVRGFGIGGICLIRLKHIRPRRFPAALGISSENAAHRIAVEWNEDGQTRTGVYIPRRDTSSRLNTFLGGRLFPGVHHHATFEVQEDDERCTIRMRSDDGIARIDVKGGCCDNLPETSIFSSLNEASVFFEGGSLGYSATSRAGEYQGLELRSFNWQVRPLAIDRVKSSFFENNFPADSVELDCALLMRQIEHEWHGREPLAVAGEKALGGSSAGSFMS